MRSRGLALLAVAALAMLGVFLRVVRFADWPPGPWIDEAYAVRAARVVAADPGASLSATSPLEPPDAGFVNHWPANLYLRFVALLDAAAGGGLASFRLVSIGPAVVLFLASLLLAREAAGKDAVSFGVSATGLATSAWLLSTGRWGWDVPATSAVAVLSAWAALVAARRGSLLLAAVSGALLGLAQYGYAAARPLLLVPLLALAGALLGRSLPAALRATAALAALLAVAAPLGLHLLAHPERALARVREVSVTSLPPGEAVRGVARNVVSYGALFLVRGDANERHGDPARPVLPAFLSGLALAGAVAWARRPGAGRLLAGAAGLVLLAGVLTAPTEGGNAYRIALAAPFLLVLAGDGARRLVALVPEGRRRTALSLLAATVAVVAALEVRGFVAWASSPRLRGAFGGPERELADAIAAETARGPATPVVGTDAVRNPFVVEALLGRPGHGGAPAVRLAPALAPLRFFPGGDLLWADRSGPERERAAEAVGARRIATGEGVGSFPGWSLFRLEEETAHRLAAVSPGGLPRLPSPGRGALVAREDGLFTLSARGGLDVRLDGAAVFDASRRPAGAVTVRLAPGPHELVIVRRARDARLRIVGPDGFVVPSPEAPALGGRP